jgi:hypothetical protein
MTPNASLLDRLTPLVIAQLDGHIDPCDADELDRLICENENARRLYLSLIHESVSLRYWSGAASHASLGPIAETTAPDPTLANIGTRELDGNNGSAIRQPEIAPSTLHAPFVVPSTYFSSGWPVAYLVATVIFGIGLVIGTLVHVSQPTQYVGPPGSAQTPNLQSPIPNPSSIVARITAMVDCVWELPSTDRRLVGGHHEVVGAGGEGGSTSLATANSRVPNNPSEINNHNSLLHLGDRLALRSGLLEITYGTGAKVILQGPVSYKIESPAGGYLSVGKLTAKLEKKSEVRGQRSETANQKSEIINHQFAIRTSTAVVTDLGTEFGVEVDQRGRTISHVFRGTVRLQTLAEDNAPNDASIILHANESACTERTAGNASPVAMHRLSINPEGFTRHLKEATPLQVLAWFRMGEDDSHAAPGGAVVDEAANHVRCPWHFKVFGSPKYVAGSDVPGSALSVDFSATENQYFYAPCICWTPSDNFILEAWFRINRCTPDTRCLVYKGQSAENGYGLLIQDRSCLCLLGGVLPRALVASIEPRKWIHVAIVSEEGKLQLWLNGQLASQRSDASPNLGSGALAIGGAPEDIVASGVRPFDGQIDEVRLSQLRGPFDRRMLLFPARSLQEDIDKAK